MIEYVIAHGAIPILSTKADNVEGDHSLNLTTARLAYEYDIPLWNFWLAVQPLPAHGMDTVRNRRLSHQRGRLEHAQLHRLEGADLHAGRFERPDPMSVGLRLSLLMALFLLAGCSAGQTLH